MTSTARSELHLRILSGIGMAAVAIGVTWLGGAVFSLVWLAVAIIVMLEWLRIVWPEASFQVRGFACAGVISLAAAAFFENGWLAFLAFDFAAIAVWFTAAGHRKDVVVGLIYAGVLAASVIAIRSGGIHSGMVAIFWLFAAVWGSDTLAYFTGRALGGPKLWPAVSPKKTWSGAIGGLLGAVILSAIILKGFGITVSMFHIVMSVALSVATQAGDLFESSIKRRFGVKDSGSIIPGHGGAMDRLDGFIFAVAFAFLVGLMRAGGMNGISERLLAL